MARDSIKGITIEIGGDISGLNKAISSANKELNGLQKELRGVESLLKLDPGNVDLLAQKEKLLGDAIKGTNDKLEELKEAKKQADKVMAEGGEVNEEQYRNLQREIVSTEQKLQALEKEQKEFGSVAKQQVEAAAKKYEELGSKVENVGKKLMPLSAASGGALVGAVKAATDMETAFTGVEKTVDGTAEELEAIDKGIQALAQTTSSSYSDIAAVAEAAGQLGIATPDILEFTETMVKLGDTTNLSAEEAATALAKFANITGMSATEYENLGSVIVDLGNNFATTEADIVNMATNIASTGELAGLTEPQIMAVSAALSSVGIEAQAGGTAFSKLLSQMQVAVETGGEDLENFAKVAGVSVDEFKAAFGQDAVAAVGMFVSGLNDTERNGKSAIAVLDEMGIKETRLRNTILSLTTSGDLLSNAVNTANTAWTENGALTAEAEKRYSTMAAQFNQLKEALTLMGATLGEAIMPVVRVLVDGLQSIANFISGLPAPIQALIAALLGLTAAAGPVLIFVGKIIMSISMIIRIMPALRAAILAVNGALAANPIGIIVAGIGVLIAWLVHLYNSNEDFRVKVQAIFEKIKTAFNTVVTVVKTGIEKIKAFVIAVRDTVANVINKIIGFINTVKEKIASIVTAVSDMKNKIIEKISGFISVGADIVKGLWEGIKGAKDWLLGKIKDWCGSILKGIKAFFGIKSPSTVMRDEVGEQLMAGLAIGMKNGAGQVMKTATDISQELVNRMDGVLSQWSSQSALQESQFKLWEMTEGKSLGEDEKLKKKLELLRLELGQQGDTIDLMLQKWTELKKQYGINSKEAMDYQNQVVQEKIKMEELRASIEDTEKAIENFGKETKDVSDFDFSDAGFDFDFSDAMYDLNNAASVAVDASYQQSDDLLNKIATAAAEYIGQALLDGLVGIQDTILAAMPAKLELDVNGRKLAETTWADYDAVAGLKSRIFAPSRQTIANIATSVVNTYVTG